MGKTEGKKFWIWRTMNAEMGFECRNEKGTR
jgi:hypothetical protein